MVDTTGKGHSVMVMGDIDVWIGNRKKRGWQEHLDFEGGGRRMAKRFWTFVLRKIGDAKTFQHSGIYTYTWSAQANNAERRSTINLVLVREDVLDVYDVKTVNMVVLCKLKIVDVCL